MLVVSGHDPTGGAGVQADIAAAFDSGVAASTLITALTVQSVANSRRVEAVAVDLLAEAAQQLSRDLPFAGIKFGLLPRVQTVQWAARLRRQLPDIPAVADPVLRAGGGGALAEEAVAQTLVAELLPQLTLITPNRAELEALTGTSDPAEGAARLLAGGVDWVLVTGTDSPEAEQPQGRPSGPIEHWLFGADFSTTMEVERLPGRFHGSGCTLSAAIAARLALGQAVPQAVSEALDYCLKRLRAAQPVGSGLYLPSGAPETAI